MLAQAKPVSEWVKPDIAASIQPEAARVIQGNRMKVVDI